MTYVRLIDPDTGTDYSESTPLTIGTLDAAASEESAPKRLLVRTVGSGFETSGSTSVTLSGATANRWALAPDNDGAAGVFGVWGASLALSAKVTATSNTYCWVKARTAPGDAVTDASVTLCASAVIIPTPPVIPKLVLDTGVDLAVWGQVIVGRTNLDMTSGYQFGKIAVGTVIDRVDFHADGVYDTSGTMGDIFIDVCVDAFGSTPRYTERWSKAQWGTGWRAIQIPANVVVTIGSAADFSLNFRLATTPPDNHYYQISANTPGPYAPGTWSRGNYDIAMKVYKR